jgi:hypothetical protein
MIGVHVHLRHVVALRAVTNRHAVEAEHRSEDLRREWITWPRAGAHPLSADLHPHRHAHLAGRWKPEPARAPFGVPSLPSTDKLRF